MSDNDSTSIKLFAYGTLRWIPVLKQVLGYIPPMRAATLENVELRAIKGVEFPAAVAKQGALATGDIITVPIDVLEKLDDYEGHWYHRIECQVTQDDGTTVPAYVYMFKPSVSHFLLPTKWDFGTFASKHGATYLAKLREE